MLNQKKITDIKSLAHQFLIASVRDKYSYNYEWLGRPIIQYPQDMIAMQELIFRVKPDLIIETGIAHGGSLILNASMLALLDYCDAVQSNQILDPEKPRRKVLGIDIDIRIHNRVAINAHPMASRIEMIQGSSVSKDVISQVYERAKGIKSIMLCLDSNHTHEHVLAELQAYTALVSVGSYCIVFDTIIDDIPSSMNSDRNWGPGNSPKTAVYEFLKNNSNFIIDKEIDDKLLISVAPDGFLKRIK
jgi:cephalosporin hydroxylase